MSAEMPPADYYEILQVHPKATLAVIKKAYRTLLIEGGLHPDHGGDTASAALLTEAYQVLSHAERRTAYDRLYFGQLEAEAKRERGKKGPGFAGASGYSGASGSSDARPRDAGPAPTMGPEPAPTALIVLCPACRTKNRVRSQELLGLAKCSRCGQSLSRLANPLADLKEHLLSLWAHHGDRRWRLADLPLNRAARQAPGANGLGKGLKLGLSIALLAGSLAALGYACYDLFKPVDPLETTERLKKEGHFDRAAVMLQAALDREPSNARLHERLGDVYAKQNLYDQAVGEYQRAIQLNPANSFLYTLQGDAYLSQRRLGDAERSYKQALALDPDQTPALVALGTVLASEKRFGEAETRFHQAIKVQPSAEAFYKLGVIYQVEGRSTDAVRSFMQALVADPNHRASMVNLARLYCEDGKRDPGKYAQAAAQLAKASQLRYLDLDVHLHLADIYERMGRTQDAIREWQTCLDQGHANPIVRERARRALSHLGVTSGSAT